MTQSSGDRGLPTVLVGLVAVIIGAASAPVSLGAFVAVAPHRDWAAEHGAQSARNELARCAADPSAQSCVTTIYRICEREHGLSTHAMTDCAVYVEAAAEVEFDQTDRRVRLRIERHPQTAEAKVRRKTVGRPGVWK